MDKHVTHMKETRNFGRETWKEKIPWELWSGLDSTGPDFDSAV